MKTPYDDPLSIKSLLRAIRYKCLQDCCLGNSDNVMDCGGYKGGEMCGLWLMRLGIGKFEKRELIYAIELKCYNCSAGTQFASTPDIDKLIRKEIKECHVKHCPLWEVRQW